MIEELVQRLIDAGTPPLVAAIVVSEAFAAGASVRTVGGLSADETTARRRAYDRERQRLKRIEAKKSADSPPTSAESADAGNNTLSSSKKDSIEKKKVSKARPKKSADFLPDDWQPKDSHFAAADRLKIPHSAVRDKAEDMRLWAKSNGVARADWDATLHVFLRKDAEKLRGSNENPKSVHAAANRLVERMRQFDEPAPGDVRSGEGGTVVRLLSSG